MSLEDIKANLRRFPKLIGGLGILTTAGIIFYESPQIRKYFAQYVDKKQQEPDKRRTEYIYIKYHIYRESMRKLQQKQEDEKKWISVIINPIGKWWKAAKHSVAWRLLNIAQNGSQAERLKAVQQLICMDHLKDWDFRHLAQICDARTSVSLARCGADMRWFMPVPRRGCIKNPKMLLSELHDMLAHLRPSPCVDHFFSKYFPDQNHLDDPIEFFTQEQNITLSVQDSDLLKEIISFLHHITKDPKIAAKITHGGGLMHLMEMRKIFADDNETLSTLCKVLANLSLVPDAVEHFFASGWVGALAEWQQCPDLRLQVISAKAMANLDHDDPNQFTYPPNVYPLHPRVRTRRKPKADIVFIHGLLGGVFITWRQRDRKPTELGLYGKNAFYTSETDDVFLVGEQKRNGNRQQYKQQQSKQLIPAQTQAAATEAGKTNATKPTESKESLLKTSKKVEEKRLNISDAATKEFVETLYNEAELDSDWEVVHPDVPLEANENCCGKFSVSGNEWNNQDTSEEYTNCWPMEWLPDDYPDSRIIGIDYTSAVTEWSAHFTKYCPCEKGQGHIDVRASTLLERIATSDVGNGRPIVWIGHSMGGLLTKLILLKSVDSVEPQVQQLAKNTKGIVFLGTPHRGSSIAKWKQHMQMILSPSIEVKEMEENSPKLLEMHRRFMGCLHTCLRHVNVVSVAEGSPTMLTTFKFPLRIVTAESSRIDFGDFFLLKDDHLSLSKPIYRQSFLYQRLLHVIREAVKQDEDGPTTTDGSLSASNAELCAMNIFAMVLKGAKGLAEILPRVAMRFTT
ncbi:protein SERAC1 isoform X2 [Drosophila grimshawi]|uniref:GH10166 n=1 Tax=Drosophila grimshawi TaxID=7222 RepID=B4JBY9_DROGR|nr:protein SERAC1 isoform X2 [Drosophila grimshawi]EDW04092.1 GH10166 [Drosophila grimshawi]